MTRLRRVSPDGPGWSRRRCGSGFRYLDGDGKSLSPDDVIRVKALTIPPAWTDVWICPHGNGHLQAVGTDAAGRRQYLYHPAWRDRQDAEKHDRVLTMGRRLPGVRQRVLAELADAEPDRDGVLAAAVRLLDLGLFRVGSDEYAETNGSFGLTTLELRHVTRAGHALTFRFEAKSGLDQHVEIDDALVAGLLARLTRRRDPHARLLAWRRGRSWIELTPSEINEHLQDLFSLQVTAKDFRTWHGTVIAASALAGSTPAASAAKRRRQVRAAIAEAAEALGNTPAVAERSYVDPRVFERFEEGRTIAPARAGAEQDQGRLDRAVVRLLS